jgi:hypothetical protein
MIFAEGRCRKWPGRIRYTDKQVLGGVAFDTPAMIVLIQSYAMWAGSSHLIVSDGRDLFTYTSDGDLWTCLTPVYTTGTTTFTNGSKSVVGALTSWTLSIVRPGMAIKSDVDGVWCEVDLIDVGTQTITLKANYSGAGGAGLAYTLRQRLAASGVHWLRALIAKNLCLVTNGVDPPLSWDGGGGTFAQLTGAPEARFLTSFHQENMLVAAGLASDALTIQNSDVDDYNEWGTGYAASYPFHATSGLIMGVDGEAEALCVFKSDAVHKGRWEGVYSNIIWRQITDVTQGPIAPKAILRIGERWAWPGDGQIYQFDGNAQAPIGAGIKEWVFGEDGFDRTYCDRMVGVVQPRYHLAFWSFPSTGAAGVNDRSIALDWLTGEWFRADRGYTAMGSHDLSREDVQWDTLTGSMDAQTRIFDILGTTPEPVIMVGDSQGYVYYLAWGVNDNGAAIEARRRTPLVRLGGAGRAVEVAGVVVDTTARPGSTCSVLLYGAANPSEPSLQLLENKQEQVSVDGELQARFRSAGKWFAVEIANDELNEEFGLVNVTLLYLPRGR